MEFKRARTSIQFKMRANQIIDACEIIFEQEGYENVNFSKISAISGITRPLIYKYFSSNEEMLLEVLKKKISNFVSSINQSFNNCNELTTNQFAEKWTKCLFEDPYMLQLYNLQRSVLEKKVDLDKIVAFKEFTQQSESSVIDAISSYFPKSNNEQLNSFFIMTIAIVSGLSPMIFQSNAQKYASSQLNDNYQGIYTDFFIRTIMPIIKSLENGTL